MRIFLGKSMIGLLVFIAGLQISIGQQTGIIKNPVLPGFNPDPCIVRVNSDYYIVTSSFEWFPGIPIYHSKDLVNWKQIGHVLTRESQLKMTGINDSDGIFAASITYRNGLFYLMYTIVQDGLNWSLKGYPNYLVTAKDPAGPWSEPHHINNLGFDPSLFIDDNGKAYILYRDIDHRKGQPASPGVGLHEFDLKTLKPIGAPKWIYSGWKPHDAEGPKMLKKDGYYYLFTADGGTGLGHLQGVARSKSIWGEYERAPTPVYTASKDPSWPVQRTGHGTLFNTPAGEWYTTHLATRPLTPSGETLLGRESFIQKIKWTSDGWPVLANGTLKPDLEAPAPNPATVLKPAPDYFIDEFSGSKPDMRYEFLREPYNGSWLSFGRLKGYLSLKGRNALGSRFEESLIAQRITSYNEQYETAVRFSPTSFKQEAGLTCYYNTRHYYALGLTFDEKKGRLIKLIKADNQYEEVAEVPINSKIAEVYLRVRVNKDKLLFYFSTDKKTWTAIGGAQDFYNLSDERAQGFTGPMVGLYCQDLLYGKEWADFDYFSKTMTFPE